MEYFLLVSFRKLRSDSNSESKKPKQITAAKFEEISQLAKLVKLTPISSVSASVPVVNSSSGLLSKDMILLGNRKELSCVTHVLGEIGHPDGPLTEQLIDLEALAKQPGFPQEPLCEPFAWVSWRHNLCYLSLKNIFIFRREILRNKLQSQFTVLSGG